MELAERYLREGESLVDGDVVKACERLYKAAEEAIKALAVAENLSEVDEARKRAPREQGRHALAPLCG